MFVLSASTWRGQTAAKTSPLKNDSWTSGQPGALTTSQASAPKTTTVDAIAMTIERAAALAEVEQSRRRGSPEAAASSGVARSALHAAHAAARRALRGQGGRVPLRFDPVLAEPVERAVGLQDRDRLVDAAASAGCPSGAGPRSAPAPRRWAASRRSCRCRAVRRSCRRPSRGPRRCPSTCFALSAATAASLSL